MDPLVRPPMIHLIDASPYVFRAYFSLPDSIRDRKGRPANAVYGFASFLLRYVQDEQPAFAGVAFDQSLTTSFRNEIYPQYKAQRVLPPPELEAQLEDCRAFAAAFGLRTWADAQFEADDFIATAIHRFAGEQFVIVTSDKDLAQLVSPQISLYDFAKQERSGPEEVRAKFGVAPEQMTDLLGLAGDAVDNIPGVRGIGPKTAVALLDSFGSLEQLYDRLDEVARLPIRGAMGVQQKLRDAREIALLSKQLATVSVEAPVTENLEDLRYRGPDREALEQLMDRLGFGTLRERVLESRS